MLARCFQGLARPITWRGSLGAFKISFGSSSNCQVVAPWPWQANCAPGKVGLDPLWIILQPPLAAFGHPPPNLQYPIGPEGDACLFSLRRSLHHIGVILDGKDLKLVFSSGASWSRVSRHKKTAALFVMKGWRSGPS